MATHDCPVVHCHIMHQNHSHMASTVQLEYIFCGKACSWRECSLRIKSAIYFTVVAFLEISSTAALVKLLMHIEIHIMAVCELEAMHRPTLAGLLLLQNCVINVALLRGL